MLKARLTVGYVESPTVQIINSYVLIPFIFRAVSFYFVLEWKLK